MIKVKIMNLFKQMIQSLSEYVGIELTVNNNNAVILENNNLLITLQYRAEREDIVIFAPVTDPDKIDKPDEKILRNALTLAYNGEGTEGNFLGLFNNHLILSNTIPLKDLTVENLSARIIQFSSTASRVYNFLLIETSDSAVAHNSERGSTIPTCQTNLRC